MTNYYEEPNTITGDLMDEAIKNTRKVLTNNALAPEIKQILDNQELTMLFIQMDHKRINAVYRWYLVQLEKEQSVKQAVGKVNAATFQIIANIIQWGVIGYLTYLLALKP